LIALELYREGRISAGKAAELADLSYDEFLNELGKGKQASKIFSTIFKKDNLL